ncbi:MAG: MarR family transcriptional regulator [Chloroflexi bacterium]|nr:MAG: MarR family transcriptional regulator [Chloroflexota bacterium]MBL1197230.1 MarR family transcriptional regulator [Chloroflexota bacterium]NOH14524.1 MarR family transcriptional regulator [Chloroflexota bacterium]
MKSFNPDEHFARLIVRTRVLLSQKLGQALKNQGHAVTPEQWAVLIILWEEDGIAQKELATRAFKDEPTTARIVKKLEVKGIVSREKDEKDQRVQLVYLTPLGKDLFPKLIPSAITVVEQAQQGFSEEEREELRRMLKVMISNLQKMDNI